MNHQFRSYYYNLRIRESPFREALLNIMIPRTTAFQFFESVVRKELSEDTESDTAEDYQERLEKKWHALGQDGRDMYEKEVEAVANDVEQYVYDHFSRPLHSCHLKQSQVVLHQPCNRARSTLPGGCAWGHDGHRHFRVSQRRQR